MIETMILILILICLLIDVSGGLESLNRFIYGKLFNHPYDGQMIIPKPFSCSKCLGWWINLGLLIYNGMITLPLTVLALLIACLSPIVKSVVCGIVDIVNDVISCIIDKLNK